MILSGATTEVDSVEIFCDTKEMITTVGKLKVPLEVDIR